MHANKSNQKIVETLRRRERRACKAWNPWAMDSSDGLRRDYVLEMLE
jgi:hypothetical protein